MSIRPYFVSRYKDGYLIEADYSQLEIRVLAALSNDEVLKKDLADGVDLHRLRAAEWLGKEQCDVTSEERRQAKQISFQLQYGASAYGIAKTHGISKHDAQRFVDSYYNRYQGVALFHSRLESQVASSRTASGLKRTKNGFPAGKGVLVCPYTKRRYTFFEKENFKGTDVSFYLPEIKNYPVQGLATGDIVPMVLGRLMRILPRDILLVNSVHDSILVDCKKQDVDKAVRILRDTMQSAPKFMKEDYDVEFDVPLPVDIKVGKNWAEMLTYTESMVY